MGKPFAVVPCCVFPTLFPERKLISDETSNISNVISYEDFVEYLLQKSSSMKCEILPFVGRNKVLYSFPFPN